MLESLSIFTTLSTSPSQKNVSEESLSHFIMVSQDLSDGPWRQSNLDAGASMIITVPAPMGGAIVVGESVIAYMGHGHQMKCTEMTPTIIRVPSFSLFQMPRDSSKGAGTSIFS